MCGTGVSRESAKIIADQSSNVTAGLVDAIDAMHGIKREALVMKECLLKGDFGGMLDSVRQGWKTKSALPRQCPIHILKKYITQLSMRVHWREKFLARVVVL